MRDVSFLKENGVDVDKSLELFGDIEMYNDSIIDFINDASKKLEQLKTYKENADMANYAIQVHALKSDARYFGFTKLADMALDQEMKSKANDMYYISDHFDELEKETEKALNIAKVYLGKEDNVKASSEEDEEEQTEEKTTDDFMNQVEKDKTILIVDDSEVIKNFIQKIFNNKYQILVASDGNEAMRAIEKGMYSKLVGVLLDLNMPNVNGFQVLEFFKENNLFERIPVSIITGVGADELVQKAYEYPIVDVLRKPFNENDIKNVVEKTVSRYVDID